MKCHTLGAVFCALTLSLAGCVTPSPSLPDDPCPTPQTPIFSVEKIPSLKSNLIFGIDTSSLISLEQSGVTFYDFDGNQADALQTLARQASTVSASVYGTIPLTRTETAMAVATARSIRRLLLANEDTDFYGNTISDGGSFTKDYPFSVQGQADCLRNVIATVNAIPNSIGVCYWEGAWISVGGKSYEENLSL